jgi:hypothetical protein
VETRDQHARIVLYVRALKAVAALILLLVLIGTLTIDLNLRSSMVADVATVVVAVAGLLWISHDS